MSVFRLKRGSDHSDRLHIGSLFFDYKIHSGRGSLTCIHHVILACVGYLLLLLGSLPDAGRRKEMPYNANATR